MSKILIWVSWVSIQTYCTDFSSHHTLKCEQERWHQPFVFKCQAVILPSSCTSTEQDFFWNSVWAHYVYTSWKTRHVTLWKSSLFTYSFTPTDWLKWCWKTNGQPQTRKVHPGLRNQKDADTTSSLGSDRAENWSNDWRDWGVPRRAGHQRLMLFLIFFSPQHMTPSTIKGRILENTTFNSESVQALWSSHDY